VSADEAARDARRAAYLDTTAEIDGHAATCSTCRSGAVCGAADDLFEAEYRTAAQLRDSDPGLVRWAYDHDWPNRPTEG